MMGKNKYGGRGYWEMDFGSLEALKDLLELYTIPNKATGVKHYKYKQYPEFNRKVLKPAIAEINEVTDLEIKIERKVKSQATVNVIFHAKRKNQRVIYSKEKTSEELLIDKLEKKLLKASPGSKEKFDIILSEIEKESIMFDIDPDIKQKSDRNKALKEWSQN